MWKDIHNTLLRFFKKSAVDWFEPKLISVEVQWVNWNFYSVTLQIWIWISNTEWLIDLTLPESTNFISNADSKSDSWEGVYPHVIAKKWKQYNPDLIEYIMQPMKLVF